MDGRALFRSVPGGSGRGRLQGPGEDLRRRPVAPPVFNKGTGIFGLLPLIWLNIARKVLILGRGVELARPGSERATWGWLRRRSGLGELLDFDFQTLSLMQMYRASDALMKHRRAIGTHLFTRAMGLFDLQPTVTLFDLTHTFFEGAANRQPKAQRGHSKDKRSDCRLLTLGLVLDGAGFVRRSQVFAGRVVIAYQLVQVIRKRLKQRVTVTFRRGDGRTLLVRKATRAETDQKAIYDALGIDSAPGGVRKMIV